MTRGTGPHQRHTPAPDRVRVALSAAAVAAGAVCLLVVLLDVGGGGPQPGPPGLAGPGPVVGWGLPIARLLLDLTAVGTVGCLLFASYLQPSGPGGPRGAAQRATRTAAGLAAAWALCAAAGSVLTLADIAGRPLGALLGSEGWTGSLVALDQSRALLLVAVMSVLIAVCAARIRTADGPLLVLVLALAALIPPVLTGHAATPSAHELALVSLSVHIVAVSLWVGGLVALVVFGRPGELPDERETVAVRRFSALALGCFTATAASGLVNAWIRLSGGAGVGTALLTTSYGALVLGKLAALAALGGVGWWHRRHTLDRLAAGHPAAFRRLAGWEVVIMVATLALAVALSRTPTPPGG